MEHRSFFVRLQEAARRHQTVLIAFGLGLAYFVIQIGFINDYGVTWDEPLHRNWGKIFFYYLQKGDRHLLELMPGHGIEYGPLYYFVNFLLSEWLYQSHLLLFVAANHLLNLMTASVAVVFLFLLGERVAGRRTAVIAVLFFVLFPPLIAHAHYNPKDIPLMTAVLITVYVFHRAIERGRRTLFLLTGFLFGVSIALKVSALLMFPVLGITYLLRIREQRGSVDARWVRRETVTVLLTAMMIMLGVIVAWPSAWGDLLLIPRSIRFFLGTDFWPGKVLFFGQEYGGAELPWFYIPLEYLMAMPVFTMLSFVIGTIVAIRRLAPSRLSPSHVMLLLWIFLPMLLSTKPGLVRYDGMRQFFFCLPAVAILAALGWSALLDLLRRWIGQAIPIVAISYAVLLLSLVHEVLLLHPFEGSYRNEIVRPMIPAAMDRQLQIEYWGPTYKQGMQWLIENAEPDPVICVPTAGILVTWYPWREDFTFECSDRSTYVMFFTRYSEARAYAHLVRPVFQIRRMNSDLLNIYRIK